MRTLSSKRQGLARKKGKRDTYLPFIALLLFVCAICWGCPAPEYNIRDDLTQYLDKAQFWAASEAQINNAIAAVRRDQFVNDDFVIETLRPAIGIARDYVQELESYHPHTPPVHNVHLEYIEAWRAHYFAITAVVDAVEKKDYVQLAKANNDLLEAQRSVSDALADLARLLKEAGLRGEFPEEGFSPPPGEGFVVSPS